MDKSESNLKFSILPKDILARRLEQTGIEPSTFQLTNDLLYRLSYSHPFWKYP